MALTEKQKKRNEQAKAAAPGKEQQKHAKELAEIRARNRDAWATHRPAEVHTTVTAADEKDEAVEVELHAQGGVVFLDSHGPVRLDKDQVIDLQKKLGRAFQAVA